LSPFSETAPIAAGAAEATARPAPKQAPPTERPAAINPKPFAKSPVAAVLLASSAKAVYERAFV